MRATRTAIKASRNVSTTRPSKGGHVNARNEPALANANVDSAAVSKRVACRGSAAASVRRNRNNARRTSHSTPKPTATSIASKLTTRPGLPEFTSRETTPVAVDNSCGMRGMAAASADRRARTAASQFEIWSASGAAVGSGAAAGTFPSSQAFTSGSDKSSRNCRAFSGGSSLGAVCANDVPTGTQKDEQCDQRQQGKSSRQHDAHRVLQAKTGRRGIRSVACPLVFLIEHELIVRLSQSARPWRHRLRIASDLLQADGKTQRGRRVRSHRENRMACIMSVSATFVCAANAACFPWFYHLCSDWT